MARAFIAVGSNIHPEENVSKALILLGEIVRITAISTVYLTEPLGPGDQKKYFNCVVAVETDLAPLEFKRSVLRRIENDLGRVRTNDRYAARSIDLDLILHNAVVMTTDELTLPDPEIPTRPFLAIPLAELAPDLRIPGSPEPVATTASTMNRSGMKPLPEYSERLRREMMR